MKSSVQLLTVQPTAILSTVSRTFSPVEEMQSSLFSKIPPERVGLHGEYDHNGLAKRVMLAFQEHHAIADLDELRVTQRGRVVILMGRLSNQRLLDRLIQIAIQVEGAGAVEVTGIRVEVA